MREEYSENIRRWYDRDPVLSNSMKILENSDDETQIKVALNIIKIIIEHNIAYSEYSGVEEIIDAVDEGLVNKKGNRWYDIDKTLRTAIAMLENSDQEVQFSVAKEMAKMVVDKIKSGSEGMFDDDDDDDDDDEDDDDFEYRDEFGGENEEP